MDKYLNSKAKKIWFWWMVGLVIFQIVLLLSLTFVVSSKTVSDVFFGTGSATLILVLVAYFSSKRTSLGLYKDSEFTMTPETVRTYLPNVKKINQSDIIEARKMRAFYQISWSLTASSISFIVALIYAFA